MKKEESVSSPLSQIIGSEPAKKPALAVALGSFDGVHAGHSELISRAVDYAKAHGIYSAVWTFKDDSSALPKKNGRILTTLSEKLSLIASLGVDYALLEDFSHIRDYSPERFVNELLIERCGVVCAVCGFNFSFGKYGLGNCDTLRELMNPRECIVVPPVYKGGNLVSSSAIRLLIEAGETEKAADMLGRPFFIDFPVVHGKQLGRTIGIPTINQNFPEGHIIPKTGIYACTVEVGSSDNNGDIFLGVSNIGLRPTVDNTSNHINCETHIINYNGWLYGKDIKVSFYKRLRDEIKFPNIDSLKAQIERDISAAIEYFSDK
ncbi:MAG: bifunctional riboflavin kinase/FAD synthetase [Clostridiales bacterium]|nr:bifunctional riboflavin kinase/FAD synthetase [Clostridiales bacterium]